MNRNYEQYSGDGAAIARFERWADSRATDIEVAAAIHTIAGIGWRGARGRQP